MVYPIYTFGDTNLMVAIFNGIGALAHAGKYTEAMDFFLIVGFTLCTIQMLRQQSGKTSIALKYLMLSTVLVASGINHRCTVLIQDMQGKSPQTVDNIPFIVAGTGFLVSVVGYNIGRMLDQAYSSVSLMPQSLLTTYGAPLGVSSKFMAAANNYHIEDQFLKRSLSTYIVDCVPPAIAHGNFSDNDLYQSDNIWSLLGSSAYAKSPALTTVYFGSNNDPICTNTDFNKPNPPSCRSTIGVVLTCGQAYDKLSADLSGMKSKMVDTFVHQSSAGLSSLLFKAVIQYNANAGAYNTTAGDYLMQSAMINTLKNVPEAMALKADSQTLMQQFAIAKAESSTISSWTTQSSVFASTFGFIFAMIQVIVYALSPLIILFALMGSFGLSFLSNWLKLMLWLPITYVILVIIQAVVTHMTHTDITQVITSMNGLTAQSQDFITAKAQTMMAAAQSMEIAAPMIAMTIVFGGSYALTSMMSHTGASTFGQAGGAEAATGNQSTDNISMDNLSGNKSDLVQQTSIGARSPSASIIGGSPSTNTDFGGQVATANGSMINTRTSSNTTSTQTDSGSSANSIANGGGHTSGSSTGTNNSRSNNITETHQAALRLSGDVGSILSGAANINAGMSQAESALTNNGISPSQAKAEVTAAATDNDNVANKFLNNMGINPSSVTDQTKQSIGGQISTMKLDHETGNTDKSHQDLQHLQSFMHDQFDISKDGYTKGIESAAIIGFGALGAAQIAGSSVAEVLGGSGAGVAGAEKSASVLENSAKATGVAGLVGNVSKNSGGSVSQGLSGTISNSAATKEGYSNNDDTSTKYHNTQQHSNSNTTSTTRTRTVAYNSSWGQGGNDLSGIVNTPTPYQKASDQNLQHKIEALKNNINTDIHDSRNKTDTDNKPIIEHSNDFLSRTKPKNIGE